MEQCFSDQEALAGGIDFTGRDDIMRIVNPLIVEPFQNEIDLINGLPINHHVIRRSRCISLLQDLRNFTVLEPACGCGNFLYFAYIEIKNLEYQILQIISTLPANHSFVPTYRIDSRNMIGYEIQAWSTYVARMVMAIAHCESQLAYGGHSPLPLLTNEASARILNVDALLDDEEIRTWHDADVIIGNPPFGGNTLMRQRGVNVAALHAAFEELAPSNNINFVCYWFLLAQNTIAREL